MNRTILFDALRQILGRGFSQSEVQTLDLAIDLALNDAPHRNHQLGKLGTALIQKWEGCAKRQPDGTYTAYPDPGSTDGHPWTIGWGSTGKDVRKGVIWTQAQCDARFATDIQRYIAEVAEFLENTPTTPNQFDALVSFHYNTGAIRKSTLGTHHKAGHFAKAHAEFARWVYNDGKPMKGLKSRRSEEAALYAAS